MAGGAGVLDDLLHATSVPDGRIAHASSPAGDSDSDFDPHAYCDSNADSTHANSHANAHSYTQSRSGDYSHAYANP